MTHGTWRLPILVMAGIVVSGSLVRWSHGAETKSATSRRQVDAGRRSAGGVAPKAVAPQASTSPSPAAKNKDAPKTLPLLGTPTPLRALYPGTNYCGLGSRGGSPL